MKSRALKLAKKLKGLNCPRCHKPRLIQRRPRVYDELRCMNCGGLCRVKT